jgi:hypothetical protein
MKKLAFLFLSLLLTACSGGQENYDCEGTGFKIQGYKASFGSQEFNLCKKEGVYNLYSKDCNKEETIWRFDTVTHRLSYFATSFRCDKVN